MSAELDMSQYLGLFLQEAEEQLEILEKEMLLLEKDPTDERMSAIFRAAHTLKGSSRAMGFLNFAEITHEMENVLDLLRAGKLTLNSGIADALLNCLDVLNTAKESIIAGNGDAAESAELVLTLKSFQVPVGDSLELIVVDADNSTVATTSGSSSSSELSVESPIPPLELAPDVIEALELAQSTQSLFVAHVTLVDDCVMKFVRAFMVINAIQDRGELCACSPDREKLEEEHFESSFSLVFTHTEDVELITKKILSLGEIASVVVLPWQASFAVASSLDRIGGSPATTVPSLEVVEGTNSTSSGAASTQGQPNGGATSSAQETSSGQTEPTLSVVTPAELSKASSSSATGKVSAPAKKSETGQTVRVDVARLDELMNLVGELVIDRTRLTQIGSGLALKYHADENIEALAETVSHISRITGDLQDQIMKARMLPIETVLNRFPRMVRDLANKIGKEIDLDLVGGETELDRSVIEVIGDPLLHILRNSIDHGIEPPSDRESLGKPRVGKIRIVARHQENHIVIEIMDDGRGIDVERVKAKAVASGLISKETAERMSEKEGLQLIFASGLSTASQVTEISGRGVGMDIVRSNIQKLGGIIDLDTQLGQGSKTSLRLPLTLAIIRGLLVTVSNVTYVLPLGAVIETLLIPSDQIQTVNKREVVVIRGVTTPLVRMQEVFDSGLEHRKESAEHFMVVVGIAEQRIGLIVDKLIGEQEVVIKSISRFCGEIKGISGATILGNGNVALIVDVNGVVERNLLR